MASLPFVSVICPTFERHAFLPILVRQYQLQTYPRDRTELVVLDDSRRPWGGAEEVARDDPRVRYIYIGPTQIPLGQKRNRLHELAKGDVLIAFDDDDVHMPERIAHSVETLAKRKVEIVGSSVLYVCDANTGVVYREGPFHQTHGTAGTMAYTRLYLQRHGFDDGARMAEEGTFTRGYTTKMAQLDPDKCIVCIAHAGNTVDKRFAFRPGRKRPKLLGSMIRDPVVRDFFTGPIRPTLAPWSVSIVVAATIGASALATREGMRALRTCLCSIIEDQACAPPFRVVLAVLEDTDGIDGRSAARQAFRGEGYDDRLEIVEAAAEFAGPAAALVALEGGADWVLTIDPAVSYPDTLLLEHGNAIRDVGEGPAVLGCGGMALDGTPVEDGDGRDVAFLLNVYGISMPVKLAGEMTGHAKVDAGFRRVLCERYETALAAYLQARKIPRKLLSVLRLSRKHFSLQMVT